MITLQDVVILAKKIAISIAAIIIPLVVLGGGLYLIKQLIH